MPTVLVASALAIFAYASGNAKFATYLSIPYIAGIGELAIFCTAIAGAGRSEEHTSELQSLMRISYAVFCLKKKKIQNNNKTHEDKNTTIKDKNTEHQHK